MIHLLLLVWAVGLIVGVGIRLFQSSRPKDGVTIEWLDDTYEVS